MSGVRAADSRDALDGTGGAAGRGHASVSEPKLLGGVRPLLAGGAYSFDEPGCIARAFCSQRARAWVESRDRSSTGGLRSDHHGCVRAFAVTLSISRLTDWPIDADAYNEYNEAFSEGSGDFTTNDVEEITGHPARSYETFARDFAEAFTPAAASAP